MQEATLLFSNFGWVFCLFIWTINLDWSFLSKQMQDEMHKALQQRDLVQSRLDSVLKQMEAREQARALVS